MKKLLLSIFLCAIFCNQAPYLAMAESSPYGYLSKEEIETMENGTQQPTSSGINYEFNKVLNSFSGAYQYTVYDINKDNCPELIIQTGISEADKHNYIYAYENEQTIKIYDEDGIHTSFAPYTIGNGIIIEWSSMAGCSINKVTYDIGSTTSQIIAELSYEDSLDDKKVDVFWDSVDKYTAGTLLTLYPASDRTHLPKSVEVNGVFDDISKEINQIREFIGRGLYLEAISDCDQTVAWHKISEADKALLEGLKEEATWKYKSYVESQQNIQKNQCFTYRMPGWGMNVNYRNDMKPYINVHSGAIAFYEGHEEGQYGRDIIINSYKVGDTTDFGVAINNPKQVVDAIISYNQEFYKERSSYMLQYGMKFDVISSNDTMVSGFPAYQTVYRLSFYNNRYWTEADYYINKIVAFQYGQWIYVVEADETAYNWSDDFWNAMEVVLNGISFS